MLRVRFRTLGCYPLTGAIASDARRSMPSSPKCAQREHLNARAASSINDEIQLDGKEEAGGLFLMTLSHTATIDGLSRMDSIDARPTLRFLTCGSVDDGKSTLIGRLLYEQSLIFDDHLAALKRDSLKHGTVGADIDFALLLDGLKPNASKASPSTSPIAISRPNDVPLLSPTRRATSNIRATWRPARPTPILLSCWSMRAKGLLSQTCRHAIIASLLGIRYVVLAVNKIDLSISIRPCSMRFRRISSDLLRHSASRKSSHPDFRPLWRQRVIA